MKTIYFIAFAVCVGMFVSCSSSTGDQTATTATENSSQPSVGQSGVKDDVSNPNIVQVAVGSKDHTTFCAY